MKIKRSIERKVFFIFGGFTLLVGLTFSMVNVITAFSIEDAILEKILAHEAKVISLEYDAGNIKPKSRLDYMTFYFDLANAPNDIEKAKAKNPETTEVFSDSNHHYHVVNVMVNQKQIGWLVADVTEFLSVSNQSSNLLPFAIFLLALAIAFSLWLAYRIALRTTKPISSLARALEMQSKDNSELDISEFETGDEIEYLACTIEVALKELKASLRRESDFNRDVSHELRTPLTVINNTLALSKQRGLEQSDELQLSNSANKITRIVKTLLALARSETLPFETVSLRSVIEDSVLQFEQQLSNKEFEIHLSIPEQTTIKGSPELIMLLTNNLIENAISYATEKSLNIGFESNQLSFSNKGSSELIGCSEAIIQPNIKQDDSRGIGQGLYLVNRIASRLNWTMKIETDNNEYRVSFDW